MLVDVLVSLCMSFGGQCIEVAAAEQVELIDCENGNDAVQRWFALSPFMEMGYHVAGWRCGAKETPA